MTIQAGLRGRTGRSGYLEEEAIYMAQERDAMAIQAGMRGGSDRRLTEGLLEEERPNPKPNPNWIGG